MFIDRHTCGIDHLTWYTNRKLTVAEERDYHVTVLPRAKEIKVSFVLILFFFFYSFTSIMFFYLTDDNWI